jgi:acylaminoacyl-peptidase
MTRRPIKPEDRRLFKAPGDLELSPDGRQVAFVLQSEDNEQDTPASNICLVTSSGGPVRRLTTSGKDRSPRWCPDGRILAFVSDRSGKPQIWLIDTTGGEAWCLPTDIPVMSAPSWSPDGKRIAFTSRVFSQDESWVPYAGAPDNDRERAEKQSQPNDKDTKVSGVKVITRFKHKMDGQGFFGDKRSQVFILDVPSEPVTKPLDTRCLTTGDFDHESASWSPCGKYIAVSATRQQDADWLQKSDIWCVEVDSGHMSRLLDASGPSTGPVFSPDGKHIAYTGHNASHGGTTSPEVRVFNFDPSVTLSESSVKSLSAYLDRPVGGVPSSDVRNYVWGAPIRWADDGYIYAIIGDKGDSYVYRFSPDASAVKVAGDKDRSIAGVSVAAGTIVYQSGSHTMPDDLYARTARTTVKLTSFGDEALRELRVCDWQKLEVHGPDDLPVDTWVLQPYGHEPGQKHPAVLMIHGGPAGVYGSAFYFQAQMLASNGIAVIYSNPRGSQAYGQQFANAVVEDWGGKDFADLMAAVDKACEIGIADADRLGVTGWSYGGYMTCWTITQTSRFKAAITGACISSRHSLYGMGDIVFTAEHYFGATPWSCPQKLLERSAVQYVDRVTTPVMILHGEADLRCPVGQAEEFFTGLRRLKKEAVMVRYPGEYHLFRKPSHVLDRNERVLAYFRHYLTR